MKPAHFIVLEFASGSFGVPRSALHRVNYGCHGNSWEATGFCGTLPLHLVREPPEKQDIEAKLGQLWVNPVSMPPIHTRYRRATALKFFPTFSHGDHKGRDLFATVLSRQLTDRELSTGFQPRFGVSESPERGFAESDSRIWPCSHLRPKNSHTVHPVPSHPVPYGTRDFGKSWETPQQRGQKRLSAAPRAASSRRAGRRWWHRRLRAWENAPPRRSPATERRGSVRP
ncbi:hypothetical protein SAMN04488093_101120 [Tropicibacter naphthalenivorans]|uniref:Uncharacterized protein n=1 Tax=Tropicibacter naphthalenivorans TaxID=441103 RepID=A0A0P1G2M4_9RHOB|nr:hypothetical protein TRN7648_00764 [Tropicibacter naphthalenivorans]SMC40232.1 hypothetical protein SAMN04488093_101120 [Tropicibacter naphthalenivorans]